MSDESDERLFPYRGGSMWPLFKKGDVLAVRTVAPNLLRVGDCIVFRSATNGTQLVAHRVVGRIPAIRTKGDHRAVEDDRVVRPLEIEGRVVGRIRYGVRSSVAGGWWGWMTARGLQWMARFDPSRQGRLGRMTSILRIVPAALMAKWVANAVVRAQFDRAECLLLRGRPVATFDHHLENWLIEWPDNLWIHPNRLPPPQGR